VEETTFLESQPRLVRINNMRPVLFVIDMQNGFCSKGGSFDRFGFRIEPYRRIIPNIKKLINFSRGNGIPIYYSKAIREASGIDCLDKVHKILPESRRERIEKIPLCIRGEWDGDIIEELKPEPDDYIVEKRRDSVFQDTEAELWLKALRVDTIIFTGIDTYICVESSVRDAFNRGYDIILMTDCVASRNPRLHEATLECAEEAFGLVITSDELMERLIKNEKTFSLKGYRF